MNISRALALLVLFVATASAQETALGPLVRAGTDGVVASPTNFAAANAPSLSAALGLSAFVPVASVPGITNSAPGANRVYGTDGSGVKGWKPDPSGGGGGDMTKSVYDIDGDGIVDLSEAVAWANITGKPSTFTPSTHTHLVVDLSDGTAAGRAMFQAVDAAAQRALLNLGGVALLSLGTTVGTVAEGNDSRIVGAVQTSRTVAGANSISGGGSLAADRTLALVNDLASPGANKVYGTDGSGVRGWKSDPVGGGGGDMVKSTYDTGNNGVVDTADAIGWAAVTGKPSTFTPSTHTHAASDIASGVIPIARLATGTPTGSKFIRDDGTLAVPAGGGTFDTNANTAVSGSWTFTGPVSFAGAGSGEVDLYDADQDHWVTLAPSSTTTENFRLVLPPANATGLSILTVSPTGTNGQVGYAAFGTGSGEIAQGNDSRIVGAVQTSRTVAGANSISGGGSLAADRTLALVNDSATPGANKVYGTDGSGVRGWKSDPVGGGGSSTNYATGADIHKARRGNYGIRMATSDGGYEWAPFAESAVTSFRSVFMGGSAAIGQCGWGESWTATGTLGIQDSTATVPLHNFIAAGTTFGTDIGINCNGFKRWKLGTGLRQSFALAMSNTNTARVWAGLSSVAVSTMDSANPNCQFVGFHYEPTNAPTWRLSTSNGGGTFTETDTGVVPNNDVFQAFNYIEVGTNVFAFINGACVATNYSNLPTTAMQPSFTLHTVSTTATTNRFLNIETVSGIY